MCGMCRVGLPKPPPAHTGWPWTEVRSAATSMHTSCPCPPPRISIITPSYNQGQFIEETIRSVLLQGYPNLEYMIMDGGSTDQTVEIIRKYGPWLSHWESEPDRGQSHAINKGFAVAHGEILGWLNSDDTYCPGALLAVAAKFHEQPDLLVVSGSCNIVDDTGRVLQVKAPGDFDALRMLLNSGGVPGQPSIFFRRSIFEDLGGLDEGLHYVMDWEYWIRIGLAIAPDRIRQLPMALSNARVWPGIKTVANPARRAAEYRAVVNRLCHDGRLAPGLRPRAYAATYRVQAHLAYQAGDFREARRNMRRACQLAPCVVVHSAGLLWLKSYLRPLLRSLGVRRGKP